MARPYSLWKQKKSSNNKSKVEVVGDELVIVMLLSGWVSLAVVATFVSSFDWDFDSQETLQNDFTLPPRSSDTSHCSRLIGEGSALDYPLYSFGTTTYLRLFVDECTTQTHGSCASMDYAVPYFRSSVSVPSSGYFSVVLKSVGDMSGFGWELSLEDPVSDRGYIGIGGYEGTNTLVFRTRNDDNGESDEVQVLGAGGFNFSRFSSDLSNTSVSSWTEFGMAWSSSTSSVTLLINGAEAQTISGLAVPSGNFDLRLSFHFLTHCGQGSDTTLFGPVVAPARLPKALYIRRLRSIAEYVQWDPLSEPSPNGSIPDPDPEPGANPTAMLAAVVAGVFVPFAILIFVAAVAFLIFVALRRQNDSESSSQLLEETEKKTRPSFAISGCGVQDGQTAYDLMCALDVEDPEEAEAWSRIVVNPGLFAISTDEIRLTEQIGEGAFSRVYKAEYEKITVAFKLFNSALFGEFDFRDFQREVEFVSSLSHPNLLRWFGASCQPPHVGFVLEFCENGDIGTYVLRNPTTPIPERLRWFTSISNCLAFLHRKSVIHRDLKPPNLLLTGDMVVKVIDLGLAKIQKKSGQRNTRLVGTECFIAPEVLLEGGLYDTKVDVYSFAMTMFVILAEEKTPYPQYMGKGNSFELMNRIRTDPEFRPKSPKLESRCSGRNQWVHDLMKKCWSHDPGERPPFSEVAETFESNEWVRE